MKNCFLFFCLICLTTYTNSFAQTILNPLDISFGDPYILKSKDKYYLYGTGNTGGKKGFAAFSSDNLKDWKREE